MAERLDDHPEVAAAEYEGEKPARELSGLPRLLVSAAAVGVSLVGPLQRRYGKFYAASKIDPGKYAGVDTQVAVIGVPNYLVVSSSMDEELAYQLTRLLFERQEELGEIHPSARQLKLETAPRGRPAPAPPRGPALLRRGGQDVTGGRPRLPCPCWRPRSAGAPSRSASAGCRCTPPVAPRPTWSSASAARAPAR